MKKILKYLDKTEEALLTVLMIIMTVSIVIQVFSRTVFSNSLAWTEEISRLILVWVTFVGASLGIKRGAHIGVEAFTMILPKKINQIMKYIMLVLCAMFTIIIFKESLTVLQKQISTGQVSAAVQIPMWIPYLGVTVGTFLMTFRFIETFIGMVKKNKAGGVN